MNNRVWILAAVVLLALGACGVILGLNLLPARAAAEARGTFAPWLGTWALIWVIVAMTVGLAGYLFSAGMAQKTRS